MKISFDFLSEFHDLFSVIYCCGEQDQVERREHFGVDHGRHLRGPRGEELVEGVLKVVVLECGPVSFLELNHVVLYSGSHASACYSPHVREVFGVSADKLDSAF